MRRTGLGAQAEQGTEQTGFSGQELGTELPGASALLGLGSRGKALLWAHLQSRVPSLTMSGALWPWAVKGRWCRVGSGASHTWAQGRAWLLTALLGQMTHLFSFSVFNYKGE